MDEISRLPDVRNVRRMLQLTSQDLLMYGDSDSLYLHMPFHGNSLYPPVHVHPQALQSESQGNHTAEA